MHKNTHIDVSERVENFIICGCTDVIDLVQRMVSVAKKTQHAGKGRLNKCVNNDTAVPDPKLPKSTYKLAPIVASIKMPKPGNGPFQQQVTSITAAYSTFKTRVGSTNSFAHIHCKPMFQNNMHLNLVYYTNLQSVQNAIGIQTNAFVKDFKSSDFVDNTHKNIIVTTVDVNNKPFYAFGVLQ